MFFSMVRQQVHPNSRILNLGAGPATKDPRCIRKGEVAELVGADIDPVVLTNDELDIQFVIEGDQLPFEDESFDLVFSDYVLEHVEHPSRFLAQVYRVLKPGCSYFFRTPNIYHYVALGARLTPHWLHKRVANQMRGLPEETHEPWHTFYRLNSRARILKEARQAGFGSVELKMVEKQPSYLAFHPLPFLAGVGYERIVNSRECFAGLRSNIFGRLTKPPYLAFGADNSSSP